MNLLSQIGREKPLFEHDIDNIEVELAEVISSSRFLVLGGAGSIGQAVVKELFKRSPLVLHVVDISENNLVELVRDIRSSYGYIEGDFKTFALDIGSSVFYSFLEQSPKFDYMLNLSALKHVRSEKDPFTLMRLIQTNILNTTNTIKASKKQDVKKYFCVSTDKAANPVNMMGASKRIMEMFAARESRHISVSMARFANVAYSDGSLLHGFRQRLVKNQPLVGPSDIKRYFITPQEAGELCLLSCILGKNQEVFFPKPDKGLDLTSFRDIAVRFLHYHGLKAIECSNENEARALAKTAKITKEWPCFFSPSNTTGEKMAEEFYTDSEILDLDRFDGVGVIVSGINYEDQKLTEFEVKISEMINRGSWSKEELVDLFRSTLPNFSHVEKGASLDSKM